MFAMQPRGLFGQRKPYGTPGIGDEADPTRMGAPGLGMGEQPQKMGLGTRLLGKGWEDKAFAIGGILQGDGGAAFRDMQERKMAPLLEEAKRQAALAEYEAKKKIDQRYPSPVNNDTVADYEFLAQHLGPEAAETFLRNKADPPQYRQGPDGQFYRVQTGPSAIPAAPVGKLTPIAPGGPTQPASGNFR